LPAGASHDDEQQAEQSAEFMNDKTVECNSHCMSTKESRRATENLIIQIYVNGSAKDYIYDKINI